MILEDEFTFELSLCAYLETQRDAIIARQLGAGVDSSGRRIIDIAIAEPGPRFEFRASLTAESIPIDLIEAPIGPGTFRSASDAIDRPVKHRQDLIERGAEIGFIEKRRNSGTAEIRQVVRYPYRWYSNLIGIENKPDLSSPGKLIDQLQFDVSLGLFDNVILATATRVTDVHLNRIPEEVGVWVYSPEDGIEVVRQAEQLQPNAYGIELVSHNSDHSQISPVSEKAKQQARQRIAERAYGKGWRVSSLPECQSCNFQSRHGTPCLPFCVEKQQVVSPSGDCVSCSLRSDESTHQYDPTDERDRRTPWKANPTGYQHKQAGLDRFC
ncbi:hypothetical protein K0C01_00335 [Salinarchaeum sp. IM2453]|uniref:DUF5787 family protein n=1 Tax=Salinarchaeum sp. IM2453 TaxID=2862870 RepID=UPI001C8337AF|nr:DUF5787 family protein [Salinarchaeum sp. IM2453]QZA88661.1 hypothetical protein K0C01_00335 [Salinarchaeum sp. IM2453]